jgi:hypothetical protein
VTVQRLNFIFSLQITTSEKSQKTTGKPKALVYFYFQKNLLKSYASFSPPPAAFRFRAVVVGAFAADLRARGCGCGGVVPGGFALDFFLDADGRVADGRERVCSFDEDGDRVELVVAFTDAAKATFFRGRVWANCGFNDGAEGGGGRLRFWAREERGLRDTSSSSSSSSSLSSSSSETDPSSPSNSAPPTSPTSSITSSPPSAPDPIASASDSSSTSESLSPSPPSASNHGASSASARSSIRSDDSRTTSRDRRSSLRGSSLSSSAASPAYIVARVGDTASAAVPGPETAGGTAYRESLPEDQSRKTRRAAAARSRSPPCE